MTENANKTVIAEVRVQVVVPRGWDEARMERVIEEIEWIDWSEFIKAKIETLDITDPDLAEITTNHITDPDLAEITLNPEVG